MIVSETTQVLITAYPSFTISIMVDIDPNLVFSIWTGSVVPLVAVLLYYWLFRRFELRRVARVEKTNAYRKFLRVIDNAIRNVNDYQHLVKLKSIGPTDPKEVRNFHAQLLMISSVLENERTIDILQRSLPMGTGVDGKPPISTQDVELVKTQLILELSHALFRQTVQVDENIEDLEAFELPEPVEEALDKVLELYGERTSNMGFNMLIEALGVPTTDSENSASWMREWYKALENLKTEIEKDLKSM